MTIFATPSKFPTLALLDVRASKAEVKRTQEALIRHIHLKEFGRIRSNVRHLFNRTLMNKWFAKGMTYPVLEHSLNAQQDISHAQQRLYKEFGVKYCYTQALEMGLTTLSFGEFCKLMKAYTHALVVHVAVKCYNERQHRNVLPFVSHLDRMNANYKARNKEVMTAVSHALLKFYNLPKHGEIRVNAPYYVYGVLRDLSVPHPNHKIIHNRPTTHAEAVKVFDDHRSSHYDTNFTCYVGRDIIRTHRHFGQVGFVQGLFGIECDSDVMPHNDGYLVKGVEYTQAGRGFAITGHPTLLFIFNDGFCHRFKKEHHDRTPAELYKLAKMVYHRHLNALSLKQGLATA